MAICSQNFKKRILCFGDSNTYGFVPGTDLRYDDSTRWPAVLQRELSSSYTVIEEGLNGRTSGYDDEEGAPPERLRNGLRVISSVLDTHLPLDCVIVLLGTNDIKKEFNTTPQRTLDNLLNIVKTIKDYGSYNNKPPRIILCTLPYVNERVQNIWKAFEGRLGLVPEINKLIMHVIMENLSVFDVYALTQSYSEDGAHMSPESHLIVGREMAKFVKNIGV